MGTFSFANDDLCEFDKFVMNELGLSRYIRYVDDIVIVSDNKDELKRALPLIVDKLKVTYIELCEHFK
jgi:hypothetical protein